MIMRMHMFTMFILSRDAKEVSKVLSPIIKVEESCTNLFVYFRVIFVNEIFSFFKNCCHCVLLDLGRTQNELRSDHKSCNAKTINWH